MSEKQSKSEQKKVKNNKNYFKDYFKKNKRRFTERNRNRKSTKKYFWMITINGQNYCFRNKKDIEVHKLRIESIDKSKYVMVENF